MTQRYTYLNMAGIDFQPWLYSHASSAVALSDLKIMNMLTAGTHGHMNTWTLAGDLAKTNFVLFSD